MVFNVLLYISLGIFSLGLVFKIFTWFFTKKSASERKRLPHLQDWLRRLKELQALFLA